MALQLNSVSHAAFSSVELIAVAGIVSLEVIIICKLQSSDLVELPVSEETAVGCSASRAASPLISRFSIFGSSL